MVKYCRKCGVTKNIGEFYKNSLYKDGHYNICKVCSKEDILIKSRTKEGVLKMSYKHQRENSKKRGHGKPKYSKKEFIDMFINDESFSCLYDWWVESGYNTKLKPSCDRLDDYKGYSFDNIQWITWEENNRKATNDMMTGKNNKQGNPVYKLDSMLNIVSEYHSVAEASRKIGVGKAGVASISKCCKGKINSYKGFYWVFKSDYSKEYISKRKFKPIKVRNICGVVQLTIENDIVREFERIIDVEEFGFDNREVQRVCKKRLDSHCGFKWMYRNEYYNEEVAI